MSHLSLFSYIALLFLDFQVRKSFYFTPLLPHQSKFVSLTDIFLVLDLALQP